MALSSYQLAALNGPSPDSKNGLLRRISGLIQFPSTPAALSLLGKLLSRCFYAETLEQTQQTSLGIQAAAPGYLALEMHSPLEQLR